MTYTRCSTQDQEDQRDSNLAQKALIDEFCKRQHIEQVGNHPDVGSGDSAERKPLWDALQHAKNELCSITVTKLDRLTRSPALIDRIYAYGVPIISAATSKPISKTEALKLAKKAAGELAVLREAARNNPNRGVGNLEKARVNSTPVRQSKAQHYADDVLERVARIFEGRDPSGWPDVARDLERCGIITSRGKGKWTPTSARNMFEQARRFAENLEAERQLD